LPRAEERDAGAGFSLAIDRRMRDSRGEDQRCGVDGELVMLCRADRPGVHGAFRGNYADLVSTRHGHHHAVVLAVPAAAGGQAGVGVCTEREQGRDQRQQEQSEQRDGEDAPHASSVACCGSEEKMFVWSGGLR